MKEQQQQQQLKRVREFHDTWCHTLSGWTSLCTVSTNTTFEYSSEIGMTHPFVRLKRCLSSELDSWCRLGALWIHAPAWYLQGSIQKALENHYQSSIDLSASGRSRWHKIWKWRTKKKKPIKTRLEIYTLYTSFCVNSCSMVNLLFKWIQSVINKEFLSKPM